MASAASLSRAFQGIHAPRDRTDQVGALVADGDEAERAESRSTSSIARSPRRLHF
jgi:hypothetical protein